jgi:hypothetical protein
MCYQVFAEGHSRRRQYSDPMTFTLKEQRKWEELFFFLLRSNSHNYPDIQLTIQRARVINDQDDTRKVKPKK